MDLFLFCAYVLILAAQIVLLIFAVRKPEKNLWPRLFCLEFVSAIAAVGLMFLFDALPGQGMAPGLTWFAEFFYSMFAAAGYSLMLLLSVVVWVFAKKKS
jgi:hypothetical protein